MDDRFFNGIIGCHAKVCGVSLTDLSPWRVMMLQAVGSPILKEGETISKGDLLQFLHVLQVKHPEAPSMRPRFRDVYWMMRLGNNSTLVMEVAKLKSWLSVQTAAPQFYRSVDGSNTGKTLSSPSLFALVASLSSKLGQLPTEVWNMRLAECRWLDATLAELGGAEINISYDDEDDDPVQLEGKEAIEYAKKTLPRAAFAAWLKARKKNNGINI